MNSISEKIFKNKQHYPFCKYSMEKKKALAAVGFEPTPLS